MLHIHTAPFDERERAFLEAQYSDTRGKLGPFSLGRWLISLSLIFEVNGWSELSGVSGEVIEG